MEIWNSVKLLHRQRLSISELWFALTFWNTELSATKKFVFKKNDYYLSNEPHSVDLDSHIDVVPSSLQFQHQKDRSGTCHGTFEND